MKEILQKLDNILNIISDFIVILFFIIILLYITIDSKRNYDKEVIKTAIKENERDKGNVLQRN